MSDPHEEAAEQEKLTGHQYDGIQEYDNPTPGWWSWIFVGSIVFSIIYGLLMIGHPEWMSVSGSYESSVTASMMQQFAQLGELQPDAPTLLKFAEDPEQQQWLGVGKAVFRTHCVSCHGRDAGGISGPNLTDDAYINVRRIEDIARVVTGGANNGAMPAWGNRLQQNEVVLVSAYVASLRGANVGGTPPQGQVIEPWASH